ncbi:glycerophosphodiester phosphodiesterase domain protein [Mycobacterium xenopi 4042]|uniref:Glycerophosphodiester phosphodiesterase domain protein n=1 Tax=Mycobacterium xenopi 4042 TaxID=1299334 RepID=X7ZXA7_MYCXE|nr:glycerophosphodiester phosphodiesterase domain protein [Mycobacterium xenopi 4042]
MPRWPPVWCSPKSPASAADSLAAMLAGSARSCWRWRSHWALRSRRQPHRPPASMWWRIAAVPVRRPRNRCARSPNHLSLGLAHWNSTLASPRTINLWCGTTRRSSPASAPTPRRRSPATRNIPTSESWCTNSPWRKSACLTAANCSASSRMRKLCGATRSQPCLMSSR